MKLRPRLFSQVGEPAPHTTSAAKAERDRESGESAAAVEGAAGLLRRTLATLGATRFTRKSGQASSDEPPDSPEKALQLAESATAAAAKELSLAEAAKLVAGAWPTPRCAAAVSRISGGDAEPRSPPLRSPVPPSRPPRPAPPPALPPSGVYNDKLLQDALDDENGDALQPLAGFLYDFLLRRHNARWPALEALHAMQSLAQSAAAEEQPPGSDADAPPAAAAAARATERLLAFARVCAFDVPPPPEALAGGDMAPGAHGAGARRERCAQVRRAHRRAVPAAARGDQAQQAAARARRRAAPALRPGRAVGRRRAGRAHQRGRVDVRRARSEDPRPDTSARG